MNYNNLNTLANILQVANYEMLLKDANNNDLLRFLQHQDNDLLNKIIEQNETIIKQNNEILELLKGGKNNASCKKKYKKNSR